MDMTFYFSKLKDSKIVAFVDVTLDEGVIVKGFRVVDGAKGLFAAVPSRVTTVDGKPRFWNQVAFTDTEVRDRFLSEILEQFHNWRETQPSPPAEAEEPAGLGRAVRPELE